MHHSVYVPHLPYPSIDGCLSCFHVLVFENSGAMNVGYRCLFELWFSQGIFLVVGLLSKSEREKKTLFINIYIYGIQKNGSDEPICRPGIEVQMQSMEDLWTQKGKERDTNGQSSTDICTPPYVKQLAGSCCIAQGTQLTAL